MGNTCRRRENTSYLSNEEIYFGKGKQFYELTFQEVYDYFKSTNDNYLYLLFQSKEMLFGKYFEIFGDGNGEIRIYLGGNRLIDMLFYEETDEQKNENCCICLEPLSNDTIVKTRCNHLFHKKCMHKFLACDENNLDCPICRTALL